MIVGQHGKENDGNIITKYYEVALPSGFSIDLKRHLGSPGGVVLGYQA